MYSSARRLGVTTSDTVSDRGRKRSLSWYFSASSDKAEDEDEESEEDPMRLLLSSADLTKPLSLSKEEREALFEVKERQYQKRRDRIAR